MWLAESLPGLLSLLAGAKGRELGASAGWGPAILPCRQAAQVTPCPWLSICRCAHANVEKARCRLRSATAGKCAPVQALGRPSRRLAGAAEGLAASCPAGKPWCQPGAEPMTAGEACPATAVVPVQPKVQTLPLRAADCPACLQSAARPVCSPNAPGQVVVSMRAGLAVISEVGKPSGPCFACCALWAQPTRLDLVAGCRQVAGRSSDICTASDLAWSFCAMDALNSVWNYASSSINRQAVPAGQAPACAPGADRWLSTLAA